MDAREPPLKRRRTSEDDSSPSRPQSHDQNLPFRRASTEHAVQDDQSQSRPRRSSASKSRENSPARGARYQDEDREDSYHRRSRSKHSSEYSSPARRTRRSTSRSRSQSSSQSRSYHSFASPPPEIYTAADDATTNAAPLASKPVVPPGAHSAGPYQKKLSFSSLYTLPRTNARGVTSVKFSPDRSLLACASADSSISIYTVAPSDPARPLKLLRTLRGHLAGVNALAWSPVGPNYTLASASDDKSILLWSPLSSDFPISPSPLTGHSNYVFSLAFSPKGNMLVSGSYDEAVFLWDVRSARVMRSLPAHSDPVSGVDFLRDGSMVCSCASDGLIRIWDSGTGQCLKTLVDEDRKPVTSVRFSPNGKFVLGWGLDGCIRLWRYAAGKCVKTYMGHVNGEYSLGGTMGDYNHGKDAFVVSGSEDGDVVVWDVSSKEVLWRGRGHEDVVLSVDFARDGPDRRGRGLLVSGGKDRDLRLWIEDRDEGAEQQEEKADINGVTDASQHHLLDEVDGIEDHEMGGINA